MLRAKPSLLRLALPRRGLALDRMNVDLAQPAHLQHLHFELAIDPVAIECADRIVDAVDGLRPKLPQHRILEGILEGQRLLYNAALEERIEAWRKARVSVTRIDQSRSLTQIRADDPQGYGALPAKLSRWTLKKVDEEFAAFFRRVKAKNDRAGFPRFRGRAGWRSFRFSEFSGVRLVDGRLMFKGMAGGLHLHQHRPLPAGASIRSCVLTRDGRAWRVALQIEIPDVHTVRREAGDLVGIDWGVESLATLATGETIDNPRFGADAAAAVRRAARKLARAKRGSRRRLKARARLARLQRKLANRRNIHLHQVSAAIARRFGAIAVEKLQVKNMIGSARGTVDNPGTNVRQNAGLNREILDTSPGMLIAMLRYKAERAGGQFAIVDARNTSQECSGCRATVRKDLSVRIHQCAQCKMEVHRDVNAARNILKRAVAGPWSGFAQQIPNDLTGGRRSGNLRMKAAV
jgi:putative transposase